MCTIAIDFDGTISADFDQARTFIGILRSRGHRIIIWSTRCNPRQHGENQPKVMAEMLALLEKHGIPYDEVDDGSVGKVHAQVYIDDKAWRFENNWQEIVDRIY